MQRNAELERLAEVFVGGWTLAELVGPEGLDLGGVEAAGGGPEPHGAPGRIAAEPQHSQQIRK